MASISSKLSLLGENLYGEQEKDPNVIFAELDKGLHSDKIGERCDAVVRFPRLFEKYPFPMLIKSSFVKVAKVFREGNNFIRLCVLQVTQQSTKHLEKLGNTDEIVRCIYSVVHSNDPIARALTLRLLGSMACIISEQKYVHHSIINSLDSRDKVELDAAMSAAASFASKSKGFAASICEKLSEMIECLSVPVDMKLKLITICENMNCDLETSEKDWVPNLNGIFKQGSEINFESSGEENDTVRWLCVSMLDKYPTSKFVLSILHTLTLLSVRSLVHLPDQMELLLQYLSQDARSSVKLLALKDLQFLAHKAPHVWTAQHVSDLCQFFKETSGDDIQLGVITVLSTLSSTVAVSQLSPNSSSSTMECCNLCCYNSNLAISVNAVKMFVNIVIYSVNVQKNRNQNTIKKAEKDDLLESLQNDVCSVLEMAITDCVRNDLSDNHKAFVVCLKSVTKLCQSCSAVTDCLIDHITAVLADIKGEKAVNLCECLSAIGSHQIDLLRGIVPDIIAILTGILDASDISRVQNQQLVLSLVRLILQAYTEEGLPNETTDVVMMAVNRVNGWIAYKIGRQAARYGHHRAAADIFSKLTSATSTEYHYFWLSALIGCCTGESLLQETVSLTSRSKLVEQMMEAESNYQKAIIALKAAATPSHPLNFQIEYMHLRTKMIQALIMTVQGCCSFQTSPPPAIATSHAVTTGLEKHRFQHILVQLKKCSQQFKSLEQKYRALYQTSFDADLATLGHLDVLLEMCRLIIYIIDSILNQANGSEGSKLDLMQCKIERTSGFQSLDDSRLWKSTKEQVLALLQEILKTAPATPLTHENVEFIEQTALMIGRWHHCLPRLIFQRLQTSDIKLAISPTRNSSEPITIRCDTEMMLKVEGIIQMVAKAKPFHNVDRIQLHVSSEFQAKTVATVDGKMFENIANNVTETTPIRNDYFCHQFLLSYRPPGLHQVVVEASIIDKDGAIWNTGPKTSLLIQAYDEGAFKQQQLLHTAQSRQLLQPPLPKTSSSASVRN